MLGLAAPAWGSAARAQAAAEQWSADWGGPYPAPLSAHAPGPASGAKARVGRGRGGAYGCRIDDRGRQAASGHGGTDTIGAPVLATRRRGPAGNARTES